MSASKKRRTAHLFHSSNVGQPRMLNLTRQHFDDGFQECPDNSPKAGEIKTRHLESLLSLKKHRPSSVL